MSKYLPHQNRRECERRLRQIAKGHLRGYVRERRGRDRRTRPASEFVSDAARYAAIGLVYPSGADLIVVPA